VIVDLEENSAFALIWRKGSALTQTIRVGLSYPSGSIFSPESQLLLCYDGQVHGDCTIQNLDITFDARGGESGAAGLLFGRYRNFILLFIKEFISYTCGKIRFFKLF